MRQSWCVPISAALILGLSACNGGDGGVAGGPAGAGASAAPAYDYFVDGNTLMAVDRMDAGRPAFAVTQLSDTSIFGVNRWFFTVRNPDNRVGIDYRNAAMLFVNNDALYRLDVSGPNAGKPMRVSNILWSQHCWKIDPEPLVQQLDQAQIKLLVTGENGQCGGRDYQYRVVKLGMSENDAPQPISQQQFYAREFRNAQGGLSGYLSWWERDITVYDSEFGNPRALVKGIGGSIDHAWVFARGVAGRYDLVDAELTNGLRAILTFDTQLGEGRLLGTVASAGSSYQGVHDGFVYFTSGVNTLVRMRLDGSSGAEDVLTFSGRLLGIDSGRVVVDEGAGNKSGAIKSYELARPFKFVSIKFKVLVDGEPIVASGRVYFSARPESAGQSRSAVSVSVGGTDEVVYPNAKWLGAAAKSSGYGDTQRFRYWSGISRIYLGSQMSIDAQGNWHAGTIDSVDAATGRIVASLGKPPVDAPQLDIRSVDDSGVALGYGWSGAGITPANTSYYYWVLDGRTGTIRQVGTTVAKATGPYGYRSWGWFTDWFGFR